MSAGAGGIVAINNLNYHCQMNPSSCSSPLFVIIFCLSWMGVGIFFAVMAARYKDYGFIFWFGIGIAIAFGLLLSFGIIYGGV